MEASRQGDNLVPPIAPKEPKETLLHGDTLVDNYYWMRYLKDDPRVMEYIKAENEYTDQVMKPTEQLQKALYDEMLGRIEETDQTVPYFLPTRSHSGQKGEEGSAGDEGYYYYTRTVKGEQYRIYCRKKGRRGDADDQLEKEEVIVDLNEYARERGLEYVAIGEYATSPDNSFVAFSVDTDGGEKYTLFFKDLRTGKFLEEQIPNTYYNLEWSNDSRAVYYTTVNDAMRPHMVHRHVLGTPVTDDVLVYHEPDEAFFVGVSKTTSEKYLLVDLNSQVTSEIHYLDLDDPQAVLTPIQTRIPKMEYTVEHHGKNFLIVTNHNAVNFKVVSVPVADPGNHNWVDIIPHREKVKVDGLQVFKDFIVAKERENGLRQFRVMQADNLDAYHYIQMPEPVYNVFAKDNVEFDTHDFKYEYTSLTTPQSVYVYNLKDRTAVLKKERKVLGGYDRNLYVTERLFAKSDVEGDDTMIPISLVYRKDLVQRGKGNPLLLYGYGAYGASRDVDFNSNRLSLLDRGYIFANGHIRGGGEMGRQWYEAGKLLHKKNTFTDFVSCAKHLIQESYTTPDQLAIFGGSAGGLLVTASMNLAPQLFKTVVALVPFVDAINTMLDESIPLTVIEFEEWGNPKDKQFYDYMKSYSPYDNIKNVTYPNILLTTGLSDPRVQYWEPLKFTAKLRATRQDNGNVVLLKTKMGSGHAGEAGRYKYLQEVAFEYAFLLYTMLGRTTP